MKVRYQSSVKTPSGWRSVAIEATVHKVSPGMVEVMGVDLIDGESPAFGQSRTGAKRQEFNGKYFAGAEVGKRKRLSAVELINEEGAP